ncbi:unnamed protein product, partial [Ixodes persulcatus]
MKLGLSSLFDRQRFWDILFLYKVANGIVESTGLLSLICFHAPSHSSRSFSLFYSLTFFVTPPLIRMQAEFNKIDSSRLDICRVGISRANRLHSLVKSTCAYACFLHATHFLCSFIFNVFAFLCYVRKCVCATQKAMSCLGTHK